MTGRRKVFVLGLDGATWKIIDPLIKSGFLPFLGKLKKENTSGILNSTIPPITPCAWASFQTGVGPGSHGVYGFLKHKVNILNPPLYSSDDIELERIWERAGKNNMKSLVVNMPMTYPVGEINGILISSFLTPKGKQFVYPKKYTNFLKDNDYVVDYADTDKNVEGGLPIRFNTERQKQEFVRKLVKIADTRVKITKKLMREDNYSFIFLLIKETDVVQHMFYDGKYTREFYRHLDGLIEEIYLDFDRYSKGEGNFLIVSDHGFHEISNIQFSPYAWYLKNVSGNSPDNSTNKRTIRKLALYAKKVGLNVEEVGLLKKRRDLFMKKEEYKALQEFMGRYGIKFTSEGIYFEDSEQKQIWELLSKLRKIEHKGKKVFELVDTRENIYEGDYVKNAPNIIWMTNQKFALNLSVLENDIFTKRTTHLKGDHISDRDGIYIFPEAGLKNTSKGIVTISNVAKIIYRMLGIDLKKVDRYSKKEKPDNKRYVQKKVSDEIMQLNT